MSDHSEDVSKHIRGYLIIGGTLIVGTIQSYTIDTGQSRQTVTKQNITEFRNAIDSLSNRIATLEARCYGNGVTRVFPGW